MSILADIRFLIKQLQAAIAPIQDILDIIGVDFIFDSLYNNLEATTISMLE